MLANNPLEMKQLTQSWSTYLTSLRLKLLLYLNAETVRFLSVIRFKSCEENFEQVIVYNLTPFCDADIPEYKLTVEVDNQPYELSHFTSPPSWQISSQPLNVFFKLNQTQTNFLTDIFDKFDTFAVLARLRTANRIARYKEKYLRQPLEATDVITEKGEFFLVLADGEKVKIMELGM